MRPTPVTCHRLHALRGAPLAAALLASAAVVSAGIGSARADARGACIEASVVSAPMEAPLALDEGRAAWVAGLWRWEDAVRGVSWGRGEGGQPAWCEDADEPLCDQGSEAPTRDERAHSTDVGVTLLEQPAASAAVHGEKPDHPRTGMGSGPAGQHRELERPPPRR